MQKKYRDCSEILCANSSATSGIYTIVLPDGSFKDVYCDMEGSNCGGDGGWTRVAYINLEEPDSACPSGFSQATIDNVPVCRVVSTGCNGAMFPSLIEYQEVCGRIRGYQIGTPEAFSRSIVISSLTVESQYLDGISITHGDPGSRVHIWSYAAGVTTTRTDRFGCPCVTGSSVTPPSFVGDDYYCDSVATSIESGRFYPADPLWDGQPCSTPLQQPCCGNPNLPWFKKSLVYSTCDDIEVRGCQDESATSEGVPFDILEIFVR